MPLAEATKWYHSNQYTAESKCEYCAGVIRHERLVCHPERSGCVCVSDGRRRRSPLCVR